MSNNSYYNDQWRIINEPNQNKVSNYSMEFDGSSDFINCGNLTDLNNLTAFSTSSWINYSGTPVTSHIFLSGGTSLSNRFYVQLLSSTQIRYGSGSAFDNVSISTISSGSWHHIVTVHNGTSLDVYLDGIKQNSSPVTVVAPNANIGDDFTIGRYNISPSYYWDGKIDQVSVFDYALSASQVSTLYGGGTAITNPMSLSPKPIAYYQLGDQSVDNGANYLVPNNSLSDYVFNFDGTDDYIDFGNITALNSQSAFSTSAWFKCTTPLLNSPVILNGGSSGTNLFYIQIRASTIIRYNSAGTSKDTTVSNIADGSWHHCATVHDGTLLHIYLDGVKQNSYTITAPTSEIGNNFIIGRYTLASLSFFNGELSNISIFNTALSTANIETIYNNGAPNDISSLSPVGWWKLNAADTFDGTDWTINDYGSGGNDGTSFYMTSANLVVSDLQQTSGYSPYALDFDGVDDYLDANRTVASNLNFSVSAWINPTSHDTVILGTRGLASAGTSNGITMNINASGNLWGRIFTETSNITQVQTGSTISLNNWSHVAMTYDSSSKTLKTYLNGSEVGSIIGTDSSVTSTAELNIGRASIGTFYDYFDGSISNVSIFNTELTSTEVTEIYNEGVPSNLNNFSGTAPVSWWQLGSNSSFNTNWTCLDETGTNNAVSVNMANNDIVDGPGYSASGLGTSSIDIKGNAPYSSANGLSNSMDVLDRTEDTPS